LGCRPVIVLLKVLLVELTHTSLCWAWSSLRIQKPRRVMVAPPVLVMTPVRLTLELVVVPLDTVKLGVLRGMIV